MSYCPKCGVELDNKGGKCPLCDYPVPLIEDEKAENPARFPTPVNIYPEEFRQVKKKVLLSITVIFVLAILAMIFENIYLDGELTWAKYSIVSTICLWVYIIIFLNFIPNVYFYLVSATLNTIVFLFILDILSGSINWFFTLGLPLVLGVFFLSCLSVLLYKYLKKKLLIFIAVNIIFLSFYVVLVEASVSIHILGKVQLFWSMITGIPIFLLGLALVYINYFFPKSLKEEAKRRFHI
ncbi:MAG: hypothetical protein HGA49_03335 [Eubacteriaceae bacterium]|nr:hypothetical protein [Eubacteriaceae bacterium]